MTDRLIRITTAFAVVAVAVVAAIIGQWRGFSCHRPAGRLLAALCPTRKTGGGQLTWLDGGPVSLTHLKEEASHDKHR